MQLKTPFLNKIVIFFIIGLRPLLGIAHCRYAVSCTKFATITLQENSLFTAIWAIVKRVCSCNPLW